jgi:hypothetical protein
MKRRRQPNLTEKLAAALLRLAEGGRPLIPEPLRSEGTAQQICAAVQFDHDPIPYANGGTTAPQNLTPRSIAGHQAKTAKVDIPRMSKGKRLSEKQQAFGRKLLAKAGQIADAHAQRKRKGPPLPCGRNSAYKKPLNGNAVRRAPQAQSSSKSKEKVFR